MTSYQAKEATLNLTTQEVIATPELSINGPATVVEDSPFDIWGVLNGGGAKGFVPLPGQPVQIYVDNALVVTVNTAIQGAEAVYMASIMISAPGAHIVKARFPGAVVAD